MVFTGFAYVLDRVGLGQPQQVLSISRALHLSTVSALSETYSYYETYRVAPIFSSYSSRLNCGVLQL